MSSRRGKVALPEALLRVERMAYGGAGLGHLDGKVCFVAGAVPGDLLRIRVTTEKRSYQEGEILEIVTPGPGRTDPPCPVFGSCGGCQWQPLAYHEQLSSKEEIFRQALWRGARVEEGLIAPIVPSCAQYGYRYRIQVKMRHVAGDLLMGFYRVGTHRVVPFPAGGCLLADPRLNRAVDEFEKVIVSFADLHLLPQLDLSVGDEGGAIAVLHYLGEAPDLLAAFLRGNRHSLPIIDGMFIQSGRKENIRPVFGAETISYLVNGSGGGGGRLSLAGQQGRFFTGKSSPEPKAGGRSRFPAQPATDRQDTGSLLRQREFFHTPVPVRSRGSRHGRLCRFDR